MLTIKVKKDAEHTKEYFKDHLDNGEYYAERGKTLGTWYGKTSAFLGISEGAAVEQEAFEALVDGKHPQTGKNLALRQKDKRRVCYDMVFSAPKTLSVMALVAQDERLIEAHHEAIAIAFRELETKAQTRVRKGLLRSSDKNRVTANLISAHFTHRSSRALDPLLHTHCVVFNTTYDEKEKRMKALQAESIYNSSTFLTAVYRNALASQVKQLGYDIEQARHGWRIRGVAKDIESLFSKRKEHIEKLREKLESSEGTFDNSRIAHLALISRAEKDTNMPDSDLLNLQLNQLSPVQVKTLQLVRQTAEVRSKATLEKSADSLDKNAAKRAIRYALDHVFERKSVVEGENLLEAALNHSAGTAVLEDLKKELDSDDFIKRGTCYMTRAERALEVRLLELIRKGRNSGDTLGDSSNLQGLKPEQEHAASLILESQGQYFLLKGRAGAGKTFTLKEIVRNSKIKTILAAPTSSATDTLRKEVSSESLTIQKILIDEKEQERLTDALLVIDEAGLLSTKQMLPLLLLAEKHRTKILFVGDTRQHNSVQGGDALRLIEEYSIIPTAEIAEISRQKEAKYRDAIQALSEGKTSKGFSLLQAMGVVKEIEPTPLLNVADERAKAVANEYLDKLKSGLSTLVVTPTWKEHSRVTEAIREKLKEEGMLPKEEVSLNVLQSLNFTQVEKQYAPNFEVGQFLSFHNNSKDFKQGELWSVQEVNNDSILVRSGDGRVRLLKPDGLRESFDVVAEAKTAFSRGDLILLKANYASSKENKIPNGTIAKIKSIREDGAIHLEGGVILDAKFRHIIHGYATTSQGAQGMTRDHVILSADSRANQALSANHFYVSTSRGTKSVSIFTDDVERLKNAIKKSSNRELVTEKVTLNGIFKTKIENMKRSLGLELEQARIFGQKFSRAKIETAFRKFKDRSYPTPDRSKSKAKGKNQNKDIDR